MILRRERYPKISMDAFDISRRDQLEITTHQLVLEFKCVTNWFYLIFRHFRKYHSRTTLASSSLFAFAWVRVCLNHNQKKVSVCSKWIVNNKDSRRRSGFFIVNFKHISHLFLLPIVSIVDFQQSNVDCLVSRKVAREECFFEVWKEHCSKKLRTTDVKNEITCAEDLSLKTVTSLKEDLY